MVNPCHLATVHFLIHAELLRMKGWFISSKSNEIGKKSVT